MLESRRRFTQLTGNFQPKIDKTKDKKELKKAQEYF